MKQKIELKESQLKAMIAEAISEISPELAAAAAQGAEERGKGEQAKRLRQGAVDRWNQKYAHTTTRPDEFGGEVTDSQYMTTGNNIEDTQYGVVSTRNSDKFGKPVGNQKYFGNNYGTGIYNPNSNTVHSVKDGYSSNPMSNRSSGYAPWNTAQKMANAKWSDYTNKITESQLKQMISETVKNVLRESDAPSLSFEEVIADIMQSVNNGSRFCKFAPSDFEIHCGSGRVYRILPNGEQTTIIWCPEPYDWDNGGELSLNDRNDFKLLLALMNKYQ